MDIELYDPPATPPRVPAHAVEAALDDARALTPATVHRTVALAVAHSTPSTAKLRLERLARVVMSTDSRITNPKDVWSADWSALPTEALEALDRGITSTWNSASTRNAMRDAVRAVIRESLNAGVLTYNEATPMLNAVRPEKLPRDEEKQSRGHISATRTEQVFQDLAADGTITARRDAALIAVLGGAGLRREEAVDVDLDHLDTDLESMVVTGKGGVVRDVPLAPGVRRAVRTWLKARGDDAGPLFNPMSKMKPRYALTGNRMSTNTVAQVVARRYGEDVTPHDLRRTFTGDLLDSGADLSVVSKILGHQNPATTAGYDRRGRAARRKAADKLDVPFADFHEES
ncbi:tyrosine-type recombinase/integrase [Nesterenkonia alba]|uniref:tyrosine-type recombinase/integrase n=1 Tax=Nesterenkonia alba TaxID=515814 RepID=UPI0003B65F97|nr:site-specific integrase [Nesterenkonia alba]